MKREHSLLEFASSNGAGKDGWSKSVRIAASIAFFLAMPLHLNSTEDARLTQITNGDEFTDEHGRLIDLDRWKEIMRPIWEKGALQWDPTKTLLSWWGTPTADSGGPNSRHVSRTIQFCDGYARPMAVVTLMGLTPVVNGGIYWNLLSLTLYGVNRDGDDIDRPILCTTGGIFMPSLL